MLPFKQCKTLASAYRCGLRVRSGSMTERRSIPAALLEMNISDAEFSLMESTLANFGLIKRYAFNYPVSTGADSFVREVVGIPVIGSCDLRNKTSIIFLA